MRIWLAVTGLILFSASLNAQWEFRDPRLPRRPDGKINLDAQPRRAADGKPDLSGVWRLESPACNSNGLGTCGFDYAGGPEFGNIAARLEGGLPYQPWAADLVKTRAAGGGKDDPVAVCQPSGALRLHTYPPYRKIVQNPGLVLILSERDVTFRQIFTDGRPLPKDPNPSFNGYSTGKWDGDTLVVETVGFRDGIWLDRRGNPMTDAAKMTERFRRINVGNLQFRSLPSPNV